MTKACTPSELPLVGVEEMRLGGSILAQTRSPAASTIAALGARPQHLLADLEVDDVVGAERLDDVRLDRQVAVGGSWRDQHAFRPDAERQIAVGGACAPSLPQQFAGEGEAFGCTVDGDARAAAVWPRPTPLTMFITGLPTNWATNRLAGCA